MDLLFEMLSPDFLSANALYTTVVVGLACPLIGVFLVMRRLIFLGVALPQISSTGVALALSLHVWFGDHHHASHTTSQTVAFIGSLVFSLAAVSILSVMDRRGAGRTEGRLGTAYVVATAASLLLLAKCPAAERGWLSLFMGEIIAVSTRDFLIITGSLAAILLVLGWFRNRLLLVSFDPNLAAVLRLAVHRWNLLLFVLVGLTVSVAVLMVGPLITFGFLVVPPLAAHRLSWNMRQLAMWSSCLGGVAAFAGFYLAYRFDLPVGPAAVGVLGAVYLLASLLSRFILKRMPAATVGEPAGTRVPDV